MKKTRRGGFFAGTGRLWMTAGGLPPYWAPVTLPVTLPVAQSRFGKLMLRVVVGAVTATLLVCHWLVKRFQTHSVPLVPDSMLPIVLVPVA